MILILMILAVYGVTTLLTQTVGPYNVLYKLRKIEWVPLSCAYCTSFWVALIGAVFISSDLGSYVLNALVITGACIITYDLTHTNHQIN